MSKGALSRFPSAEDEQQCLEKLGTNGIEKLHQ